MRDYMGEWKVRPVGRSGKKEWRETKILEELIVLISSSLFLVWDSTRVALHNSQSKKNS